MNVSLVLLLMWGLLVSGTIISVCCVLLLDVCLNPLSRLYPQRFSPHECLPLGQARRAPRLSTRTAPQTRRKTTAPTTPRWTGGSSCATLGTWSQRSGQLCTTIVTGSSLIMRRSHIEKQQRSSEQTHRYTQTRLLCIIVEVKENIIHLVCVKASVEVFNYDGCQRKQLINSSPM